MNTINKNYIKKLSSGCLFIALSISITACKKTIIPYIDDSIALVYQDNKPYLINAKKETYPLSAYDSVIDLFDEYIMVENNSKYGFILNSGKECTDIIYDRVYPMKEEKAVVIYQGNTQIIDKNGKVLYEFTEGWTSDSYFSQNNLLIHKANVYSYLVYDEKTTSFSKIDQTFPYGSVYKNNYAVVGKYDTEEIIDEENGEVINTIQKENLKYNFINLDHQELFESYEFDFADTFYNGWARVGNIEEFTSENVRSNGNTPVKYYKQTGIVYHYINERGTTLKYDGETLAYPYALNFYDGMAIMAKYVYSELNNTYLKEYMIINTGGRMNYIKAIYYQTNFYYGKDTYGSNEPLIGQHGEESDTSFNYQTQTSSRNWFGNLQRMGNTFALRQGNTLNNSFWKILYLSYDTDKKAYLFKEINWDIITTSIDDNGETIEDVPQFIKDYTSTYSTNKNNYNLAITAAKTPYEMNEFKRSQFYDVNIPITSVRLIRSNKYGLVKLSSIDINSTSAIPQTDCYASYILDPIYDKIIF